MPTPCPSCSKEALECEVETEPFTAKVIEFNIDRPSQPVLEVETSEEPVRFGQVSCPECGWRSYPVSEVKVTQT